LHLRARFALSAAANMAKREFYQIAENAIGSAIALEPNNLNLQLTRAVILQSDRKLPAARQVVEAVLERDPRNISAWLLVGKIHENLDNAERAIDAYENVISYRTKPAQNDTSLAAHLALGTLYLQVAQPEQSIVNFDIYVTNRRGQHPMSQKDALLGRAAAHAQLGNSTAALQDINAVINGPAPGERFAMAPSELSQLLAGRAMIHYEIRRNEEAAADMLRSVELGGKAQLLKLQLFLKRQGMSVKIDGEKSDELREQIRKCFAEDACRDGLATEL
jgi:tetratricopeptide (TPR) repeat protein